MLKKISFIVISLIIIIIFIYFVIKSNNNDFKINNSSTINDVYKKSKFKFPIKVEKELDEIEQIILINQNIDFNNRDLSSKTDEEINQIYKQVDDSLENSQVEEVITFNDEKLLNNPDFLEKLKDFFLENLQTIMLVLEGIMAIKEVKEVSKVLNQFNDIKKAIKNLDKADADYIKNLRKVDLDDITKILNDTGVMEGIKKPSKIKNLIKKGTDELKDSLSKINNVMKTRKTRNLRRIANQFDNIDIADDLAQGLKKGTTRTVAKLMRKANESINIIKSSTKAATKAATKSTTKAISTAVSESASSVASKVSSKLAKAAAKASAKTVTNVGQAIPFVGMGFAIAGGAMCFAAANNATPDGILSNEYADDPEAVTGANIACGLELALDIALESLELMAQFGAILALCAAGPIGMIVAAIVALIQIFTAVLDAVDPCGYNRPIEDDKKLAELKYQVLLEAYQQINIVIEEQKGEIRKTIISSIHESFLEYELSTSLEETEQLITNDNLAIEKFGTTFKELYGGVSFDDLLDEQMDTLITDVKYPRPVEFMGNKFFQNLTDEDFIKYTEYMNEYFIKCNLVWNNISIEDRRNAAIRKNNLNRQREFSSIINLNVANKNLEIQESNIDNLSRIGGTLNSLTNILEQVDEELNIFIETFKRRRTYIRERVAKSQISPIVAKNISKSNLSSKITHLAKLKMKNYSFNLINEVIELGFTEDNAKIVNKKIDEYIKVQKDFGREQLKIMKKIIIMRK